MAAGQRRKAGVDFSGETETETPLRHSVVPTMSTEFPSAMFQAPLGDLGHLHTIFLALVTSFVLYLISVRYGNGLKDIPGPFWASMLPFDRLWTVCSGKQCDAHIRYHKKYGPLVRVGPHHVSFADGAAIPTVYSIGASYPKTDFYAPFDTRTPRGWFSSIFSTRDETAHRALKRPVAHAYSMSTMFELEPLADTCIKIFEQKLDAMQGKDVDLGKWLHFFGWDVISSIAFSNRLGFMEQEKDVGGIIRAVESRQTYSCIVGEAPILHRMLLGNRCVEYIANLIPMVSKFSNAK